MPTIDVFVTSIFSNPLIRSRHERVLRNLTATGLEFTTHDVASSEEAKSYWKRKNGGRNELPAIIVDGQVKGTIEEFDEAVEFDELYIYLGVSKDPKTTDNTKEVGKAEEKKADKDKLELEEELSTDDLAQLEKEFEDIKTAFNPTDDTYSTRFAPTAPLAFGPGKNTISITGKGKDRVEVVRPLSDRPLAEDHLNELDLESLGLSEEDARQLAKELGLLSVNDKEAKEDK